MPTPAMQSQPEFPDVRPLRDAGVLVPLYRDRAGELRLVVIRRTEGGIHGGPRAFPGGVRDAGEEIGLARERVEILAALAVVETRITGFRIAPFLARIDPPESWLLSE